jgi:hypothetical protein
MNTYSHDYVDVRMDERNGQAVTAWTYTRGTLGLNPSREKMYPDRGFCDFLYSLMVNAGEKY